MKRVYLCGKISGEPFNMASKKFKDAEKMLLEEYFPDDEIVNPIEHCKRVASIYRISEEVFEDWKWCMSVDFAELLTCDVIALLPDWMDSVGARIEYAIARELKLRVHYINII